LGLLGMLAGERGAVLALRYFDQPYEAPPIQTPAHPSEERTPQTPRG
jgi:hypothetical protein